MPRLTSENWSGCPVRYAATVVGDAWALVILRDLIFRGSRHFGDFVAASEGISTNILTDRLQRLEAEGIVTRNRDPEKAVRVIYQLTEKGRGLVPVVLAMIDWAQTWDARTEVPDRFIEALRDDPAAMARAVQADLAKRAADLSEAGQAEGNQQAEGDGDPG
ncbi:winged helix-turn-helix transcriptional regulator [Pseudooceanicola onchidii]|uniref:winged helix-turn-helix transcriptional regulator n=1 Tax=Pseudooceanicola onchidii TaxID=2562279 RepID=UPI0010AA0212|nr:helix-turn-helix domain-containing protein [Pseudooceanicola onchidii]